MYACVFRREGGREGGSVCMCMHEPSRVVVFFFVCVCVCNCGFVEAE